MSEAIICDDCGELIKGSYFSIAYMIGHCRLETLHNGYPKDFHKQCLKEWANDTINNQEGRVRKSG